MKSTVKLDRKTTQQTLNDAVKAQAQIILESAGWGPITINGFLISGDDKALLMEVTGKPALQTPSLLGVKCGAQLYCDQRYLFNTSITGTPQWGDTRSIALDRPNEMSVLDRRRFARAKLAPSSQVKLEWTHQGLVRRYVAALLNISPDGMSCRMEGPVGEAVRLDETLTAKFNLPGQLREFVLEGAVLNITHTDENRMIVGLQFVHSQRYLETLMILRQALHGRAAQPAETKVLA